MNRKDAKKLWPIIKAYGDGEEVEWLPCKNNWKPKSEGCGFDQGPDRYRIKPKVQEFWVLKSHIGPPVDRELAYSDNWMKVREVLSE